MKKTIFRTAVIVFSLFMLNACVTSKDAEEDAGGVRTDAELIGTYWKVTSIGDMKITTIPNEKEIYLILENDGNFKGFSGCNRFYGKQMYDAVSIRIDELESTKMGCPSMDREAKLYTLLTGTIDYEIKGEDLILLKNKKVVATLEVSTMK